LSQLKTRFPADSFCASSLGGSMAAISAAKAVRLSLQDIEAV
jgi:hypothetical protein